MRRTPREATGDERVPNRLTVLLTGASGGIGRAIAADLAERGHRVVLHCHRRLAAARALAQALPGAGHAVVQADLADAAACEALVADAVGAAGSLDVLVNNAGIYQEQPPLDGDSQAWRHHLTQTLAINLLAPSLLSHAMARHLAGAGRAGRIVNISSRGAFRGEPTAPAYGASKAGLNAMGQSLAQALAPAGIAVFTVAPGFVATEMAQEILAGERGAAIRAQSPFGRVAAAEEVAAAAVWLALEAPAFMSGCIVDVNGASYLRS